MTSDNQRKSRNPNLFTFAASTCGEFVLHLKYFYGKESLDCGVASQGEDD